MKPQTQRVHAPDMEQAHRDKPKAIARRYELSKEETDTFLSGGIERARKARELH